MSRLRDTNGPRFGSGLSPGELVLVLGLVTLVILALSADAAAALIGHHRLLGPIPAIAALLRTLRDPRDPGSAWPAIERRVSPALFWGLTGTLTAVPVGVALALCGLFSSSRHDGFASAAEVCGEATVHGARRLAKSTRPSLTGRHLAAEEVGYPLGRSVTPRTRLSRTLPLICSWEHSLQLVAPPGAGKTLRVLAPILRQHPGPVLATSTKPDLYEIAVGARQRIGPVVALDPDRLCPAAPPLRWSPISGCADSRVAQRRASALVAAAGHGADVRGGGFFQHSAATVLAAYLHAAALDGFTMHEVLRWAARPRDTAPLRLLAAQGPGSIDWGARLHAHTSGAEETTSGVMRTVDLALACFSDAAVLEQCSPAAGEEFAFDAFFSERGSIFALGKDRGPFGGTAPLVTAFCDELLVAAEQRSATMAGRRLDPPLLACLDEAPSIAPLPALPSLLADGRGRGITTLVAMQSFSQAEARWGADGARTIRNAASVLVVFGGLSVATDLEEISRLCGTRRIERSALSEDDSGRSSASRQLVEEQVLTAAEIRALPAGTALVFFGALPPVLTKMPGIWEGSAGRAVMSEEKAARLENDSARSSASAVSDVGIPGARGSDRPRRAPITDDERDLNELEET